MNRDLDCDLHIVRHEHLPVHERLENWRRYISDNGTSKDCAPMFKQYRSSEVWQEVTYSGPIDRLDGHKMEKAIAALPQKHGVAIRWVYVYHAGSDKYKPCPPWKVQKFLGVTRMGLVGLIHDARSMLKNRQL